MERSEDEDGGGRNRIGARAGEGAVRRAPRRRPPWYHLGLGPNRLWLAAMVVFVLANLANFASFAFAAQSLLAALGSIQFVSNVAFARLVNKERITARTVVGTVVIVAGCVVLVTFGSHDSPSYTVNELLALYGNAGYIVYLCVGAAVSLASYVAYWRMTRPADNAGGRCIRCIRCIRRSSSDYVYRGGEDIRGGEDVQSAQEAKATIATIAISAIDAEGTKDHTMITGRARELALYVLFSAIVGTQSVLYGKSLSLLFRAALAGTNVVRHWYSWVCLLAFLSAAFYWVRRFNQGLRNFDVMIAMPAMQVGWILFSLLSGALYFQEFQAFGGLQWGMFCTGVVAVISGVACICLDAGDRGNRGDPGDCGGGSRGFHGRHDAGDDENGKASEKDARRCMTVYCHVGRGDPVARSASGVVDLEAAVRRRTVTL